MIYAFALRQSFMHSYSITCLATSVFFTPPTPLLSLVHYNMHTINSLASYGIYTAYLCACIKQTCIEILQKMHIKDTSYLLFALCRTPPVSLFPSLLPSLSLSPSLYLSPSRFVPESRCSNNFDHKNRRRFITLVRETKCA